MEILLLGIYAFFVWLIFIKFKLLPWTTPWKVGVAIFPVVMIAALMLLLNIFAPDDRRRPGRQVRGAGRVAGPGAGHRGSGREQPAREEGRRAVPDRSDPVPERGQARWRHGSRPRKRRSAPIRHGCAETEARLPDAQSSERQLNEQLNEATAQLARPDRVLRSRAHTCLPEHRAGRGRGRQSLRPRDRRRPTSTS